MVLSVTVTKTSEILLHLNRAMRAFFSKRHYFGSSGESLLLAAIFLNTDDFKRDSARKLSEENSVSLS